MTAGKSELATPALIATELPTLYYAHDPMCSWCWGFRPVWQQVQKALAGKVNIRYLLGGLAPDTSESMPVEMQINIRDTWRSIQREIPGTEFNFDFWTECLPRRSTYSACRAIIACRMQQPEKVDDMLLAIQQAYYLHAQNPSDTDVLIRLAGEAGLNEHIFANDIQSETCRKILLEEIELCRNLNMKSFPNLVIKTEKSYSSIDIDYNNSRNISNQIIRYMHFMKKVTQITTAWSSNT